MTTHWHHSDSEMAVTAQSRLTTEPSLRDHENIAGSHSHTLTHSSDVHTASSLRCTVQFKNFKMNPDTPRLRLHFKPVSSHATPKPVTREQRKLTWDRHSQSLNSGSVVKSETTHIVNNVCSQNQHRVKDVKRRKMNRIAFMGCLNLFTCNSMKKNFRKGLVGKKKWQKKSTLLKKGGNFFKKFYSLLIQDNKKATLKSYIKALIQINKCTDFKTLN